MMIEIRKAGFNNKGAELMLYAILEKLKEEFPDAKYCMAPILKSQPYNKRIKLDFYQKFHISKKGINFSFIGDFLPKKIKNMFGIVTDKEVDIVLDAAGFSYSDQWGLSYILELYSSSKRWKKNNVKSVLLPQAFGPFSNKYSNYFMKRAIKNIDLVYAREEVSYNYLQHISDKSIRKYPDFTNLLNGSLPENFKIRDESYCIIPNYRMIDKADQSQSELYISFLIKAINYLKSKNKNVFILLHDTGADKELINEIDNKLNHEIEIVYESNPIHIKGIIGSCSGVIGSRFHGLVSALSQGVPTLATGWSHKYQMLFEEYNFIDGLLDISKGDNYIFKQLDLIIDEESKRKISAKLLVKSKELKLLTEKMWLEVISLIRR
jgi:polysaccharide pyruvyl transferase WcaK-like protein